MQKLGIFRVLESRLGNLYIMDTVANILTIIINGQRAQKKRVVVPYSTFAESLLAFMKKNDFIGDVRTQESPIAKLVVSLSYSESGKPKIGGVKRISKPGRRVYAGAAHMPYSYQEAGMIVVSTPQGLMDEKHARGKKVGGELICAIW